MLVSQWGTAAEVAGSSGQEVWVSFSFFSCSTSSFCETDSPLEQQPPRRSREVWDGWPVLCFLIVFASCSPILFACPLHSEKRNHSPGRWTGMCPLSQ